MANNRDHQKIGELELSAQRCSCGGELLFACVFHVVAMPNIFADQIPKLLSLSLHLKTGTACSDKQGAIACIPKDDI